MVACGFRLEDTGRTVEAAGACCGQEFQAVHRCSVRGECIEVGTSPGLATCIRCEVPNRPPTFPTVQPIGYKPIKFIPQAERDGAFNCSLHGDERNGFAFAFRSGWTSSGVRLCRLSDQHRPTGVMYPASTMHARSQRGSEDPRLFRFRDRWHFAYTGYEADQFFSSVLVAEIDAWPNVSKVWAPRYSQRKHAEKNWGFFDHHGRLHAVYRIGPGEHQVLRFEGDEVFTVYSTQWTPAWDWGEMRGGASPQLHNGEWYSFFHGFRRHGGVIVYSAGLYTFEARPPFRPLRRIKAPLVIGGFSHVDDGWRKHIYYPCGAAIKAGKWHISAGEHDNRCTVAVFDAAEIEKELKPWA